MEMNAARLRGPEPIRGRKRRILTVLVGAACFAAGGFVHPWNGRASAASLDMGQALAILRDLGEPTERRRSALGRAYSLSEQAGTTIAAVACTAGDPLAADSETLRGRALVAWSTK